jgi:hypothetical protein
LEVIGRIWLYKNFIGLDIEWHRTLAWPVALVWQRNERHLCQISWSSLYERLTNGFYLKLIIQREQLQPVDDAVKRPAQHETKLYGQHLRFLIQQNASLTIHLRTKKPQSCENSLHANRFQAQMCANWLVPGLWLLRHLHFPSAGSPSRLLKVFK